MLVINAFLQKIYQYAALIRNSSFLNYKEQQK